VARRDRHRLRPVDGVRQWGGRDHAAHREHVVQRPGSRVALRHLPVSTPAVADRLVGHGRIAALPGAGPALRSDVLGAAVVGVGTGAGPATTAVVAAPSGDRPGLGGGHHDDGRARRLPPRHHPDDGSRRARRSMDGPGRG